MQPFLYGLLVYIGWGTGDIFGTISIRKVGAYQTTFWVFVISFILFSLYVPFALSDIQHLTLPLLLVNLLLGLFYISGNVALNEAFHRTNPSVAGTISGAAPVLILLFSVFFFKEVITLSQIGIISLVFLGVFLCTFDFSVLQKGKRMIDTGVFYALYAMSSFAIFFSFIKTVVVQIGWFWTLYIPLFLTPLIYVYMRYKKMKIIKPTHKNALLPIFLSAFLLRSGDFIFNAGLSSGYTTIVAPIAGSYPTLFASLAFLIFKDPIKKQQIAGIILTLVGIVLLSLVTK